VIKQYSSRNTGTTQVEKGQIEETKSIVVKFCYNKIRLCQNEGSKNPYHWIKGDK
jgi:hypothetical protein